MHAAARLIPPAFLIWLYWKALGGWFQGDDFAWLGLSQMIQGPSDILPTFFRPMAQGTVRPFSERLYFIVLHSLTGFNALAFRLWAFGVMALNVALVQALAYRLTRDRLAAFVAAILWAANLSLVEVMTWNSVYNQAACALVLTGAFYLLVRYVESGDRRFWMAQWAVYTAGFGVMELNVVYPAIALLYTLLMAREHVRRVLWLFLPAIAYAILHRAAGSGIAAPSYGMHFDLAIFDTFWRYWQWGFHTTRAPSYISLPVEAGLAAFWCLSGALLAFAFRHRLSWFFLGWFVLTLAPVLPLKQHISTYYLTIPTIGLALLGGAAFAAAWRWHAAMRVVALGLVAVYGYTGVASVRRGVNSSVTRSRAIEHLVGSVVRARQLHPDKLILITDLDAEVFWLGMIDNPFRLIGVRDVYLAPEMEKRILPRPELGRVADYVLPAPAARRALVGQKAVVYSAGGPVFRNVTAVYEARLASAAEEMPRRVDCGSPAFADYMGSGWHEADAGVRWMADRATARMAAPRDGERLYVNGYRAAEAGSDFSVQLTVSAGGKTLGRRTIRAGETQFAFDYGLPVVAGSEMIVELKVSRTFRTAQDGRDLGLAFGVLELR